MSHVGRRFDLVRGGKPLRVLVVGQESRVAEGSQLAMGSQGRIKARHHQIHDVTGLQKRYYAESGHGGRNPHMRGTTSALRTVSARDLATTTRASSLTR